MPTPDFAALYLELLKEHRKLLDSYREAVTGSVPVSIGGGAMHLSEEEEDAKHLLDSGLINQHDYRDLLARAGFNNTNIELD